LTGAVVLNVTLAAVIGALLAAPTSAEAQVYRHREPNTPFSTADFAKLSWLSGRWISSAPQQRNVYEQFALTTDSTIDITYFRDSSFAQPIGNGRIYLSVGRIYHTFGPDRWGATHVGKNAAFFIPQVAAQNSFAWKRVSATSWTSTMRMGAAGQSRVVVWTVRRASSIQH
jgi:hypothetical protein